MSARSRNIPNSLIATNMSARCATWRLPSGNALRTWCRRPRNAGFLFSCLFHVNVCLGLALFVCSARHSIVETESIAAMLVSDSRPVQFELESTELEGGGGGSTEPAAALLTASAAASPESNFEIHIAPLPLPVPDQSVAGMTPGPGSGHGRGVGRGDGPGSRKPPGKNAVTEGSFTVWTIPDDPIPGETYTIMIEVRLPEKVTRYPRHDLVGLVTGTDGWQQPLPGDAKPLQQYLPVHNHAVQLEVDVPGALRRVRDTIELRSKLLKEEQVLNLVF